MTTVLIFAGIPLAVISIIALLIFGGSARRAPRYRPGRPFPFAPVWFVSAEAPGASSADEPDHHAIAAPASTSTASLRPAAKKGGARGTW